jgi:hypothetical protein
MLSGIYFVNFIANTNKFGEGLVVIKDGCINGGDFSYLYQGRFDYYGEDIKANIEIKHYKGPMNNVMGPLKEFTLNLSGKKIGDKFEVTGGIPNMPNLSISIKGAKVSELFE